MPVLACLAVNAAIMRPLRLGQAAPARELAAYESAKRLRARAGLGGVQRNVLMAFAFESLYLIR